MAPALLFFRERGVSAARAVWWTDDFDSIALSYRPQNIRPGHGEAGGRLVACRGVAGLEGEVLEACRRGGNQDARRLDRDGERVRPGTGCGHDAPALPSSTPSPTE